MDDMAPEDQLAVVMATFIGYVRTKEPVTADEAVDFIFHLARATQIWLAASNAPSLYPKN